MKIEITVTVYLIRDLGNCHPVSRQVVNCFAVAQSRIRQGERQLTTNNII